MGYERFERILKLKILYRHLGSYMYYALEVRRHFS